MGYAFPPDVERLLQEQMTEGAYASQDDVLRDALEALASQRREVVVDDPEVIAGIERGLEQLEQGLGRPWEEFDRELRGRPSGGYDG